jgi:hypothetical protein
MFYQFDLSLNPLLHVYLIKKLISEENERGHKFYHGATLQILKNRDHYSLLL